MRRLAGLMSVPLAMPMLLGAGMTAPRPAELCTVPGQQVAAWQRDGGYVVRADAWAADLCIRPKPGGFRVTWSIAAGNGVTEFPDVFYGWAWGLHSRHTVLPRRITRLGSMSATWKTGGYPPGIWNKALDLWVNAKPSVKGQDTGGEVMVWSQTRGYTPAWLALPEVKLDGKWWHVDEWRTLHANGLSWPLVIFDAVRPFSSVHGLRLAPFLRYAAGRHWITLRYYLTSVEAGNEINYGGKGLSATLTVSPGLKAARARFDAYLTP